MFSLGVGTKFWLYTKPTDMRKNFNMLSGIVNGHMGQNLYSGDMFVFVNGPFGRSKLWKSLKIVYLCPTVRGLLPGYALQSTTDRDKTWEDNQKQG